MTYRSLKSVHWCIRPDHPRRRIEMWFCMVGDLCVIVVIFNFDQNRLRDYRDISGQNFGSCITLADGLYSPVPPYRRYFPEAPHGQISVKFLHSS